MGEALPGGEHCDHCMGRGCMDCVSLALSDITQTAQEQAARIHALEAERDELRATLERVRAVQRCDYDHEHDSYHYRPDGCCVRWDDIRAALDDKDG